MVFVKCCTATVLITVFFCTFWRLKTLVLWQKVVQDLVIFAHLFCPKKSINESKKSSVTQERLVVESCPIPRWIAFLMLYCLVYNLRSYELLQWTTFGLKCLLLFQIFQTYIWFYFGDWKLIPDSFTVLIKW